MNHAPFHEMMTAALDAPLPPADRAALDAHLAECDDCRELCEALNASDTLLTLAPAIPAPVGFAERASARLAGRASLARMIGGGVMLAVGTVAVAALTINPLAGAYGAFFRLPTFLTLARALLPFLDVCRAVGGGGWLALTALLDWSAQQPIVSAGLLATLPLVGLWAYWFNKLSPKVVTT
ncbi:MAG: zf-HC2 domain-containing protein [Chloroflexi bacterium]|nr:zf-HC2 domain-containing protein [Chloroflexota bacterium]